MKLSRLAGMAGAAYQEGPDPEIKGIRYDSRNVQPGDLFFAMAGQRTDGKNYVREAVSKGAAGIVSDAPLPGAGVPVMVVEDLPGAMAAMSAGTYGHPDRKLLLTGITGTNGKTTITYFIESIFALSGLSTGVVGTVNYRYGNSVVPASNTTPQSADLYRMFAEMSAGGVKAAVMEVSSHALALGRASGLEFDIAVFTNLTRDHLDFHGTIEEYFEAKSRLFSGLAPGAKSGDKCAVINLDDPWGKKLVPIAKNARIITYGIKERAMVRAEHIKYSGGGSSFQLVIPDGRYTITLRHIGRHNISNALAAAGAAVAAGIPADRIVKGLENAPSVPGRLELVTQGQPYTVVVDFAHTDDALRNVLTAVRELKPRRIITVFGCGGDRDRSKRPIMGEAATELSDFVFVTSDNPRTEIPEKIALDIEVGIRRRHRNNYQVILDREQAIASAISMARKGDVILIAGKGHETYQIVGTEKHHFNDVEVALKYIAKGPSAAGP